MKSDEKTSDNCVFPRCRNRSDMQFYSRRLCNRCWEKWCDEPGTVTLRTKLGIGPMKVHLGDGVYVLWRADGAYPAKKARKRVSKVVLRVKRRELKTMAKELGVTWIKDWSKAEAKEVVRAAMLKAG